MAKARLFVAINISDEVRSTLRETVQGLIPQFHIPIRFLTPENWHLTLSFLGYQPEEVIPDIKEGIRYVVEKSLIPEIVFEHLVYGPVDSAGTSALPRMVWVLGAKETSQILGKIKTMFEDAFEAQSIRFERETRAFQAHLTIARFEPQPKRRLPAIERPLRLVSPVITLDLMESILRRTGAEYTMRSAFDLKREV